ncbi:unnamed protein product [Chrysoparadoxa australica]
MLLGAGEEEKSTVFKQIKSFCGSHMTDEELAEYKNALKSNVLEAAVALCEARRKLDISIVNPHVCEVDERLHSLPLGAELTISVAEDVADLWTDQGIQSTYARRKDFWLLDSAEYYMNNCMRIANDSCQPTCQDIMMARIRTTGASTHGVDHEEKRYTVVDVGGQRNERRKWASCFDKFGAVLYLGGLSGYAQRLFEDNSVVRMHESLDLLSQVVQNLLPRGTPIFVLLSKLDLFLEYIKAVPLSSCFPDYTGPEGDPDAALDFIKAKYTAGVHKPRPDLEVPIYVLGATYDEEELRAMVQSIWQRVAEMKEAAKKNLEELSEGSQSQETTLEFLSEGIQSQETTCGFELGTVTAHAGTHSVSSPAVQQP